MLIVFAVIGILLLVIGTILYHCAWGETAFCWSWVIGGVILFIAVVAMILIGVSYSYKTTVDGRIELYTEENAQIETRVKAIVDQYIEHESSTFEKIKADNPITLATMFPELKSDAVVQQQIELYVANNAKIKELKEEKLNYRVCAWWLFFGDE